jgi:outer membrane protein assembly factor BamB
MLQLQPSGIAFDNRPTRPANLTPPRRSWQPFRAAALGAVLLASAASAFGQTGARAPLTAEEKQQGFSNRSVLAKLHEAAVEADARAAELRDGVQLRRAPVGSRLRVIEVNTGESVPETIARLRATGRYAVVEPDYIVKIDATPNDPRFLAADQWGLRNIGQSNGTAGADVSAESGWDIRTSAADIVVAIIDSGMRRTHEDLVANLWVNPGESGASSNNGRDDDGNGYIDDVNGINATVQSNIPGSGNPTDDANHGTGVASIIGAVGNNGVGMTGVAWNVKLMPLRFIDADGYGLVSDEIECIDYAIAKRAHLINASFGGANFSQSLFDALKRARDAGIIVVCAAGNDATNSDLEPHYPAGYLLDNIVGVANTTRSDVLSTASTYGAGLVDLGAPGTSMLVASSTGNSSYEFTSGTSFSAPMVTGALALIKARFPNETHRETINRLLRSVDRKPALSGKTSSGGRLNLSAALRTTTARPFNDDFAQRAAFVGEAGVARSAAQLATREAGEPVHAGTAGNGSLWWSWTAPRGGNVTIDTTGSIPDTLLSVYTGTAVNALGSVATNDDESTSLKSSKVTFNAVAGTTYQIAVDCKDAAAGLVLMRLNLQAGNNDFASAQLVSGRSWSIKGDNRNATREAGEPRIRNNTGGRSVWYRWVPPASRRYHIATSSQNTNTMLGIYTGNAVNALTEIAAATTAGDTNFTVSSAGASFSATAGTSYYIAVDTEVSSTGTQVPGDFTISCIDSEWEFFGNGAPNTVAIASDGTLHTVDFYGDVFALNTDGSRKWRYTMTGYGTYSAPAVAPDGTVYVGDDFNYIHAISTNGNRKWRVLTLGEIQSSPAIGPDGTVYVRSEDGRVHALNPDTGTMKWTFRMGTPVAPTYSSPVVAPDGTVYCAGGDSKLYAISPLGIEKWSFATNLIFSSPAIGPDGTVYFGTIAPTRRFYALRPDGSQKWEFIAGDTVSSSPAIASDGTIYFGCGDRRLYAVTSTGTLRWTFDTGGPIHGSSPIIASDGSIIVGCLDGKVYQVESDGRLRRFYATADEVRSSPVLHNGRLYISSWDSRMYAIDTGLVPASSPWPMHRQNVRRTAVVVTQPLGIGVQPRAQSAEVGDTITFSVGALGSGTLTYQWLFNGQAISGATNTSYRVDPVTHGNGGQYSVRVTDTTGTLASSSATLTITTPLVPPSVVTAPLTQTTIAGTPITLSVAAIGTTPMTFQWLRDGVAIPGATSNSLYLDGAGFADAGSYSVRITNFAGTITSQAASLTVNPVSRIANLSIRSQVGGPSGVLTVGVTIGGTTSTADKPLLLRAIGPTLAGFGVTGALTDPQLAILSGSNVIAQNDDWAGNAQVASTSVAVGAFGLANDASKDAVLAYSAAAGGYTVRISGPGTSSGVALAEVYDASPSNSFVISTPRLINVSALTQVGTGGDVLIAGFSITGVAPKSVLIRGVGPSLATFGVVGALADPKLEVFTIGATTAMATNDNWPSLANPTQAAAAAASVGAFALGADSKDAVLVLTLPPGTYTAQVSDTNNTTGLALVEIYELP